MISMNHKQQSFETCFSAGLDLTEFSGGGGGGVGGVAVHCASADLAQQKAKDCARRNREENAEAELEQRVAAVAHAASKSFSTDATSSGNPMALGGDIHIPRALHPKNATKDEMLGNDRDNNFIQFQNDASSSGGLLSSLVSDHKREELRGTISHKSRQLMNQRKISSSTSYSVDISGGGGGISTRRQVAKSSAKAKSPVGKTTVAKKPRKSKY